MNPPQIPPVITPGAAPKLRTVKLPTRGYICAHCGEVGTLRTVTQGSLLTELLLYLLFLIPGIIYTLWRLNSRHGTCRTCGSPQMVPIRTPRGRHLAQQFNPHVHITT